MPPTVPKFAFVKIKASGLLSPKLNDSSVKVAVSAVPVVRLLVPVVESIDVTKWIFGVVLKFQAKISDAVSVPVVPSVVMLPVSENVP